MSKDEQILLLEDRIAELEDALGTSLAWSDGYRAMGLTGTHRKILGMLMRRPEIHKEQMYFVLYGTRPEHKQPDPKVLMIHIYNLRKKLNPMGIRIRTIPDTGWMMTPADKKKVKDQLRIYLERIEQDALLLE